METLLLVTLVFVALVVRTIRVYRRAVEDRRQIRRRLKGVSARAIATQADRRNGLATSSVMFFPVKLASTPRDASTGRLGTPNTGAPRSFTPRAGSESNERSGAVSDSRSLTTWAWRRQPGSDSSGWPLRGPTQDGRSAGIEGSDG